MKKSAIMQMFYGQRGECQKIKLSKEYFNISKEVLRLYNEMLEKLKENPELLRLFKEYDEKRELLSCQSSDEYYLEGFRFGALIGVDIISNSFDEK